MFRATFLRCFLVAGLLAFVTSTMWAQTSPKSAATQNTAEKKFRGRLPNNFARIGLSTKQREDIYALQGKYHEEIEELETRLAELKVKQNEEILAVLTPEQKEALAVLQGKTKTPSKTAIAP